MARPQFLAQILAPQILNPSPPRSWRPYVSGNHHVSTHIGMSLRRQINTHQNNYYEPWLRCPTCNSTHTQQFLSAEQVVVHPEFLQAGLMPPKEAPAATLKSVMPSQTLLRGSWDLVTACNWEYNPRYLG